MIGLGITNACADGLYKYTDADEARKETRTEGTMGKE